MKKFFAFTMLLMLLMTCSAFGQTHYCMSVSEVCCNSDATTDTATTLQAYANFTLYWDTGSVNSTVFVEITDSGTIVHN